MNKTETTTLSPLEHITREVGGWAASQLEACTRCGICAAACPFYEATGDPQTTPIWKLDLLRRAYEQRSTVLGKLKVVCTWKNR